MLELARKPRAKETFFNIPCAFDIETSSFYQPDENGDREKTALMYEWTFGICGYVIIGRTWDEFTTMCQQLRDLLGLCENRRLLCYVHNLNFEFQFMRKLFNWVKIFSIDLRRPVYAITDLGIEFRCSYILSGYSLKTLATTLKNINISKLVGDLDYTLIRHSQTPLTAQELQYCVNDVKIVMAFICDTIEQDGTIAKIPLTKTGYVRNYCRKSCFYGLGEKRDKYKYLRYSRMIRNLQVEPDEYKQLKRAFSGGFTHANPFYSGKIVNNVTSFDFTSSYPAVMLAEKFPMSPGKIIRIENMAMFEKNLKLYCCLFDIKFYGLQSKLYHDSYISLSRCWKKTNCTVNNGRIVAADEIGLTITEQDFYIIRDYYTWHGIAIGTFRRYRKDYLPTDFVKSILKLYTDKTTLKGVEGAEERYTIAKGMLNACYGMCVTDIVRDVIEYTDEWQISAPNLGDAIEQYNNSKSRFLFYPWGVWVTAYARRNLFTGITEFGRDYIYSDTDSIKIINAEKHANYIRCYNRAIQAKLSYAMKRHGLPADAVRPKTIDGDIKPLGVWDFDGHYRRFKTLGAKRYMTEYSNDPRNKSKRNEISITVSGLNKRTCVPYLKTQAQKLGIDIFAIFNDNMDVPADYTGKMTHTYIDEPKTGMITDYLGNTAEYTSLSGVHLENAPYSLSIALEYARYILGLRTIETGE